MGFVVGCELVTVSMWTVGAKCSLLVIMAMLTVVLMFRFCHRQNKKKVNPSQRIEEPRLEHRPRRATREKQ